MRAGLAYKARARAADIGAPIHIHVD